jgi:magnesium chelatase subunit I
LGSWLTSKRLRRKQSGLAILENVLTFEDEWAKKQATGKSEFLEQAQQADEQKRHALEQARKRFFEVDVSPVLEQCVALAEAFEVEGNRGERVLAMAARAHAALHDRPTVTIDDLRIIAPLAFQHRRMGMEQNPEARWTPQDAQELEQVLNRESGA